MGDCTTNGEMSDPDCDGKAELWTCGEDYGSNSRRQGGWVRATHLMWPFNTSVGMSRTPGLNDGVRQSYAASVHLTRVMREGEDELR